jgi:hypothetical protein
MAAYSIIIFSTIINFTLSWFVLFFCGTPIHFATKILDGQCLFDTLMVRIVVYMQAASNMVVDIGLLILPISTVSASTMTTGAKLSVLFIFVLACS